AGASGLAWATAKVDIISVSGAGPPKASSFLGVTIPTVVGGETSFSWAATGDAPERMRATMAMRAVIVAAMKLRRVNEGDCRRGVGEGGGAQGILTVKALGKNAQDKGRTLEIIKQYPGRASGVYCSAFLACLNSRFLLWSTDRLSTSLHPYISAGGN